MTKRDFEAIAAAIKKQVDNAAGKNAPLALAVLADEIADYCERSNPRFNRHKFLKACGMRGGE